MNYSSEVPPATVLSALHGCRDRIPRGVRPGSAKGVLVADESTKSWSTR